MREIIVTNCLTKYHRIKMDATYTAGSIVTMEPTALYGYIPTHWLAILFVVSCIFTLLTGIPALFFKYPNPGLGYLIVLGTLCQLVGHVCMAVSSFRPANLAPWGVQLFAFMFGKTFARFAALSTYHACFLRVAQSEEGHNLRKVYTDDWFIGGLASIAGLCFGYRLFYDLWQFGNLWTYYGETAQSPSMPTALSISLVSSDFVLLATTLCLIFRLVLVIIRTRQQTPWFRLTWMSGYHTILIIIPMILVIQDVYEIVRCFVLYRNEMLELFGNMGMTKSVLMLLACQYYELAYAWSQKRPVWLEKLECLVMEARQVKGEQRQKESDQPTEV